MQRTHALLDVTLAFSCVLRLRAQTTHALLHALRAVRWTWFITAAFVPLCDLAALLYHVLLHLFPACSILFAFRYLWLGWFSFCCAVLRTFAHAARLTYALLHYRGFIRHDRRCARRRFGYFDAHMRCMACVRCALFAGVFSTAAAVRYVVAFPLPILLWRWHFTQVSFAAGIGVARAVHALPLPHTCHHLPPPLYPHTPPSHPHPLPLPCLPSLPPPPFFPLGPLFPLAFSPSAPWPHTFSGQPPPSPFILPFSPCPTTFGG